MSLFPKLDQALQGTPDHMLTGLLILVAIIATVVAIYANPAAKAAVAAWFVLP